MGLVQFSRRIFGFNSSGKSIDKPTFRVSDNSIHWTCHVCQSDIKFRVSPKEEKRVKCPFCGIKRVVRHGILEPPRGLFSRKKSLIFVTNATLRELEAKRYGKVDIPIRKRLVYHTKYDCGFAHKNYEVDGILLAYNTGVVETVYDDMLQMCKPCAKEDMVICYRCGGKEIFLGIGMSSMVFVLNVMAQDMCQK